MRPRLICAALALSLAAVLGAANGARADSRYAGTYTTTRPGAESTQELTLVLDRRGRATLTTRFPDLDQRYGPKVLPVREAGTWRDRGGRADVRLTTVGLLRDGKLTSGRRDNNVFAFSLQRCSLIATQYSTFRYGEAGLSLEKSGCRG